MLHLENHNNNNNNNNNNNKNPKIQFQETAPKPNSLCIFLGQKAGESNIYLQNKWRDQRLLGLRNITLPETKIAPEDRPGPKRKLVFFQKRITSSIFFTS